MALSLSHTVNIPINLTLHEAKRLDDADLVCIRYYNSLSSIKSLTDYRKYQLPKEKQARAAVQSVMEATVCYTGIPFFP